jgi:iron-regulated transporter 1
MEDLEPNEPPAAPPPKYKLSLTFFYTSHFLFTWNDRVWEFASVIFLIAAYPQTLLPSSIFGLVTTASAILFGPAIGRWFDAHERLMSVRAAILVQRIAVAVGCVLLWLMIWEDFGRDLKSGLFAIVNILGCFAKLAFVGKTVSIERDWV